MNNYQLILLIFLRIIKWIFMIICPVWLVCNLIRKYFKVFALLWLCGLISGCTSNSNTFSKSPCACEFKPINTENTGVDRHA